MPPLSLTISLQTLNLGPSTFGPASVDNDVGTATLTIDRTVSRAGTQGFNGQPATTLADLVIEASYDGGATWRLVTGARIVGGLWPDGDAGPFTASYVSATLDPGSGRRVRATVTVAGARVAVMGTLTVT